MASVLKFRRRRNWKHRARRADIPALPVVLIVSALLGLAYLDFGPASTAARSTVLHLSAAPTGSSAPRKPGASTALSVSASFNLCGRYPHYNCVIDGDTFYLKSQSIRIADIDTPETHPSRCAYEAALGARATHRLQELLNADRSRCTRSEIATRTSTGASSAPSFAAAARSGPFSSPRA